MSFKLVNNEREHQQLDLTLMSEDSEGHNPSLPVATLGQVKPRRCVNEGLSAILWAAV